MKKLFLMTALLFGVLGMTVWGAKMTKPVYVAFHQATMEISRVSTTDKGTTLTFQYGGSDFGSFSPGCYLVDEGGMRYKLTGQKGFSRKDNERLVATKKGRYELTFEPLPAGTRIFDFIEDQYSFGGTSYYGIRQAGDAFRVSSPRPRADDMPDFSPIDFKSDSVRLSVCITDYDTSATRYSGIYVHYQRVTKLGYIDQDAKFGNDGCLTMTVFTDGPGWAYIHLLDADSKPIAAIPVMLFPGDSQGISLSHLGDAGQNVGYTSRKHRDYARLMSVAPSFFTDGTRWYDGADSIVYEHTTADDMVTRFADIDSLASYLVGKYGLSGVEERMLRAEMTAGTAIGYVNLAANYLWRKTYYSKGIGEWLKADSQLFNAVGWVEATDNTFFVVPSAMALCRKMADSNMTIPSLFEYYADDAGQLANKLASKPSDTRPEQLRKWMENVRRYRQKGDDDTIFEQAMLYCNLVKRRVDWALDLLNMLPNPPHDQALDYGEIHRWFNIWRLALTEPSLVRLGNELIQSNETDAYRFIEEDYRKRLELGE